MSESTCDGPASDRQVLCAMESGVIQGVRIISSGAYGRATFDAAAKEAIESLAAYRYAEPPPPFWRNGGLRDVYKEPSGLVCTEPLRSAGRAIVAEIERDAVSAKIAADGNKNPLFRGVKPRFELHPTASLPGLTPKQHVFLTLGNLIKLIGDGWDLEKNRDQLKSSLENAASWEPLLANLIQEPSTDANHGTLSDQEDTGKP